MAWTNDSYQVTATGDTAGSDTWANVWSFLRADPGADTADLEAGLISFYTALEAYLADTWSCTNLRIKNLGTGIYVDQVQSGLAGTSVENPLPPQCAIRASLKASPNINGGPFLCGWAVTASDEDGQVFTTVQDAIADAVETMQSNLLGNDWVLGIARPTLEQIVSAQQVRVGQRFDVIRRRANDTPEAYDTRVF